VKTFVCSKCGAEESLSRLVTVEGWEGIEVEADAKGTLSETTTGEQEVEWDTSMLESYHCSNCDRTAGRLEDLVVAKAEAECRDCGFAGEADDHPASCAGELLGVEPPEVHPQQTALVEVA